MLKIIFLDFTRCVTDGECYERAIIEDSTVGNLSSVCPNPDHVVTCTDVYNSVSDYPTSCEIPEVLEQNFGKVETCMMRVSDTSSGWNLLSPPGSFPLKDANTLSFKCART